MKFKKFKLLNLAIILLLNLPILLISLPLSASSVIFTNNTSHQALYIWPVPAGTTPAAMAAMIPAHALPAEFQMPKGFSNMYVLSQDDVLTMKNNGVNIQDPNAVINWVKTSPLAHGVANLPVSKTWMGFDGKKGPLYAEQIVKY